MARVVARLGLVNTCISPMRSSERRRRGQLLLVSDALAGWFDVGDARVKERFHFIFEDVQRTGRGYHDQHWRDDHAGVEVPSPNDSIQPVAGAGLFTAFGGGSPVPMPSGSAVVVRSSGAVLMRTQFRLENVLCPAALRMCSRNCVTRSGRQIDVGPVQGNVGYFPKANDGYGPMMTFRPGTINLAKPSKCPEVTGGIHLQASSSKAPYGALLVTLATASKLLSCGRKCVNLKPAMPSAIRTESEWFHADATPRFHVPGSCGIASLMARPLWAQERGQDESEPAPRVLLTWGKNGHGDGEFDIPIAVAVNQADEILVTDFRQSNADARSACNDSIKTGGSWEPSRPPHAGGLALDKKMACSL